MKADTPNILIRIGSLRSGGAEKALVTLLKNLPKDRYNIDLLLNLRFGEYLPEVPDWVNIYHLNIGEMITTNRPHEIPIKAYRKIYQHLHYKFPNLIYHRILKGKKYEVEIAANHVLAREMMRSPWKSSKKIAWVHSDIERGDFPTFDLPELLKFDTILCISKEIKTSLLPYSKNKNQLVDFYNPIDIEKIKSLSNENAPFPKGNTPIFFSIGTLYDAKGFDRLIKAHAKLIKEGFPHSLWIAGDGSDKQALLDLTKNLGVEESVTFLGFQKNPYPYFKKADAYILSSRYEGFPTVLFEAVVLKKDIISTEVSGANEMLEEGKLGEIVENSEEGIYKGMKKYLTLPEAWEEKRKNLEQYQPPFSLESSTRQFMAIIDDLCEIKN